MVTKYREKIKCLGCTQLFLHFIKENLEVWFRKKSLYYGVNTEHFLQTPVLRGKSRITELLTSLLEERRYPGSVPS